MSATSVEVTKRPAEQRGRTELGWLHSRHAFAFGQYRDPEHAGYRALRVINDDIVEPGGGFGTHPHRDMEILSYVISGSLEHKDSLGNGRTIRAGELQYMSAGSGVRHSEYNPSATEAVHFLQIWIEPDRAGGAPRYADMDTNALKQENALALFASPDGRDGSVAIRQDAEVHFARAREGAAIAVPDDPARAHAWIHVISGRVAIADELFGPGDGGAIEGSAFEVRCMEDAEFLLFRLP
jgi:redox-sensitive bicupin YhaK (pirin superfamily)